MRIRWFGRTDGRCSRRGRAGGRASGERRCCATIGSHHRPPRRCGRTEAEASGIPLPRGSGAPPRNLAPGAVGPRDTCGRRVGSWVRRMECVVYLGGADGPRERCIVERNGRNAIWGNVSHLKHEIIRSRSSNKRMSAGHKQTAATAHVIVLPIGMPEISSVQAQRASGSGFITSA